MRRYLFTSVLLVVSLSARSQQAGTNNGQTAPTFPVDPTGRITYQSTKDVGNAQQSELYKRARKWFINTYNSGKDVLQINDPATGELSGKGQFMVSTPWAGGLITYPVWHSLTIEVKDGRYRYTMTGFSVEREGVRLPLENLTPLRQKFIERFVPLADTKIRAILESLQTAMQNKGEEF